MIVDTQLSVDHIELIKIFVEANELIETNVIEREVDIRGKKHRMLTLHTFNEDSATKLTFMGLRHAGVLNMLDDFLLKCDVSPLNLQPASIRTQENEEKEAEREAKMQADLEKQMQKIKETHEHINK
jgi:hypothetical protein